MKKFIMDAFVTPVVAITLLLGFGGIFVLGGYQTFLLSGSKFADGSAVFDYTQEHFWGLVKFSRHFENVKRAEFDLKKVGSRRHRKSVPTIMLVSDDKKEVLLGDFSNVSGQMNRAMRHAINAYLQDPDKVTYAEVFKKRDPIYWVGLPLCIIGVLGILNWPRIILQAWKQAFGAQ